MNPNVLLAPILAPVLAGIAALLLPKTLKWAKEGLAVAASLLALIYAWVIFSNGGDGLRLFVPWTSFGINFDLYAYHFPRFILLAAAGAEILLALYSASFMHGKWRSKEYFAYFLITAGLANGAILANNFVVMLFFWEALLVTLYGMISLGHKEAHVTSTKALIISGLADFCMILGIVFAWNLSGTLTMSEVHLEPVGLGAAAFILMGIGAMAKAGAMPFHTWIPDAAIDAPLPFMAFLPGALEKLLGIYMLGRISLDLFTVNMNGAMSMFLMIAGAFTIVLAVLMALIQKDYKKLLSFHAVSQVGYMIMGIGTGTLIGIAGGIFHMLNNAMYKCMLFLTGGAVEKQAGTTDLKKLGGLGRTMPVTAACFWVAAFSISGLPLFNGFVSKEMVFHGSLETGYIIFPIAAWIGAIFTFASFLKLGHSTYLGKPNPETPVKEAKDPDWAMQIPMIVIAAGCVLFGLYSKLPLKNFIAPILAGKAAAAETGPAGLEFWHHFTGYSVFSWIAGVSIACLIMALLLHRYGVNKARGKAYLASEPVHNFPVMHTLYDWAEARVFDIYEWFIGKTLRGAAWAVWQAVDRGIDAVYEHVITFVGKISIGALREYHNGLLANYLSWVVGGFVLLAIYLAALVK
ncbi:MAG: proton-conducting transporter membrane subunit [Candidatus Edwardsbacteria bacterium]|nr:proton-conducting transporter membrane subunit [Candidatus Edwardsbacteria bacterium]